MMVNNSTNINKQTINSYLTEHKEQMKVSNSTNINKTNNQLLSHRTQRTNDGQQFYREKISLSDLTATNEIFNVVLGAF